MPFRIRDPIHNFVVLDDRMIPLVNARVIQRLRGIRQLALACLVYPGALHTRFDHSLGVAHVAGLMAEFLELTPDETRLVQLAAILHDVGHGPFSHVSEASLARFADTSKLKAGQEQHKIHEIVTAEIIRTDPGIASILSGSEVESVVQLLDEGHGRPLLRKIISGPLDADKQDYLLRDAKFCGVEYGTYDLQQFLRTLVPVGTQGDEDMMVDADGIHAIEQFMLAKYYMTANVYRHRVRLISDQMIGRAIRLGIELDELELLKRLYQFDNSPEFISNYLHWDDARFFEVFCPLDSAAPGAMSGELLRRLRTRTLLKRVYSQRIEVHDARVREQLNRLAEPQSDKLRDDIERQVAEFLSKETGATLRSEFVIAHCYGIKSVRESAKNDEGEVLVKCTNSVPRYFSEESKLLGSINQAFADEFVEVYAPIEWPDGQDK